MTTECGCKGIRFCAVCELTPRVQNLRLDTVDKYADFDVFLYFPKLGHAVRSNNLSSTSSLEEIKEAFSEEEPVGEQLQMSGLMLIENFLSSEEEDKIMEMINTVEWAPSQSGRRKQDYGPKVNFKHKKVKTDTFHGMPEYADMLLTKMKDCSERLGNYQPFEMCNLEYVDSMKSSIEMHQDDMWIWGNRLISINLLSGSVMSMCNESTRQLCYVYMPHRSLLCMADHVRYDWKHGVFSRHIVGRRIALTMREPSPEFQVGGELYEKFGKELIRLGNIRVPLQPTVTSS